MRSPSMELLSKAFSSPVESLFQDVYPEHGLVAVGDILRLLLSSQGALLGLVPALLLL